MRSIASVDQLTVMAIGVMAYAGAYTSHEIIGHCGMALVVGTKCKIISGGIVTVTSAFFSGLDQKLAQLQAAGGTFGLTIWLLLLPLVITGPAAGEVFQLRRSTGWIIAGALTAIIFIGVLGPGIAVAQSSPSSVLSPTDHRSDKGSKWIKTPVR